MIAAALRECCKPLSVLGRIKSKCAPEFGFEKDKVADEQKNAEA